MNTTRELIGQLEQSQSLLLALVSGVDAKSFRAQYHVDLSPLGWHLGHCVYTECYWLYEQLQGDDSITAPISALYVPPNTPKAERGKLLPPRQALLAWSRELQASNRRFLEHPPAQLQQHALMQNDYLLHFLIQHNSQHYESMQMILAQKALVDDSTASPVGTTPLRRAPLREERVDIPAGQYRIGGQAPTAYDNEVPSQHAELAGFSINRYPVSNAEYLAFMEEDGYERSGLWPEDGWQWRQDNHVRHPDHWRQDADGQWYSLGLGGHCGLDADEPVFGISHHEATAFARWAGGRLPHELQWEAACRSGLLQDTGQVWEWCGNCFYPYEGYQSFPYDGYSQAWFDNRHFTLRGGSLHTRPPIRRPSFRNFFEAGKRHVFAGLRLVF